MVSFFNDTATTEIYTYCHTLSLHDARPISRACWSTSLRSRDSLAMLEPAFTTPRNSLWKACRNRWRRSLKPLVRSEEHTSELQSLMRISYAVFCLKKKNNNNPSPFAISSHKQYTTNTTYNKNKLKTTDSTTEP